MEGESGRQDLASSSNDKKIAFAEFADELCPIYMSMGVPYDEYWHGDYTQLAYYYKAFELKRERDNYDAWLQGVYVYDAICAVSPVMHAFAKRGTKPIPYLQEPYGVKKEVDPEAAKVEFLAKWKANKTRWKQLNARFKGGE